MGGLNATGDNSHLHGFIRPQFFDMSTQIRSWQGNHPRALLQMMVTSFHGEKALLPTRKSTFHPASSLETTDTTLIDPGTKMIQLHEDRETVSN
jgi:hypothetical protein